MAKVKISELTLEDLINYEKALTFICKKYENMCQAMGIDEAQKSEAYSVYMKYSTKYAQIITEIEKRADNLSV